MAYGAYQLAQPRQSLLDSMTQRSLGSTVDPSIKKKSIMDEFKEKMERESKSAQKRSQKWQPVTQALDFASGFVDPVTAAALGAVSGGLSGFDKMRAYEGIKDAGKGYEKYSFMDEYLKDSNKQISGMETDMGDVLVSAGTGALKNFVMGEATKALGGVGKGTKEAIDPLSKATEATKNITEAGGTIAEKEAARIAKQAAEKAAKQAAEKAAKQAAEKAAAEKAAGDTVKKVTKAGGEAVSGFKPEALEFAEQGAQELVPQQFEKAATTDFSKATELGGFKGTKADWLKNLQEGGGEDMLKNLFGSEASTGDIMSQLAAMTQMGMNFADPFLNKDKVSQGFDLGY